MKINCIFSLVIAVCVGCANKPDPQPDPRAEQLEKLSKTWKASSVKLNDVVQTGYDNFQVTLSGQSGAPSFTYSATPLSGKSPWPANGALTFGESFESVIIRDKGTPNELSMNYAIGDHNLTFNFTYTGNGFPEGRQSSLNGQCAFVFSNP